MRPLLKDPERQKMYEHIVGMFIVTWLLLIALFVAGCKNKVEAVETERIYADSNATWMFEGTFCSECNQLYNYIEHPKICDKCGLETKDFYYLALIKERK